MPMRSFSSCLLAWYKKNARDLPWRKTNDPYKIWISEVMLQQTTVSAVIPYYNRWIKSFPTVEDVVKASSQKLLRAWQGLGYYQRVKNIQRAAAIIQNKFAGSLPQTAADLKQLPGFGPYTTGAVLSIAFGKRFPIIDANVRRLVMRILALQKDKPPLLDQSIHAFLDSVMPVKQMSFFNQGLMELGALICRSKNPQCLSCPVTSFCQAYHQGLQEVIPAARTSKLTDVSAVVGVLKKKDQYFIQKRASKGLLADLWEFPGGKIEAGESPAQALSREMREELSVQVTKAVPFLQLTHFYTHYRVKLHVYFCEVKPYPVEDRYHKWVSLAQMAQYPLPSGSARIVKKLA